MHVIANPAHMMPEQRRSELASVLAAECLCADVLLITLDTQGSSVAGPGPWRESREW